MSASPAECIGAGCDKPANQARGLCRTHYARWQRHGDPDVTKNDNFRPATERFWHRVELGDGGCWLWTGGKTTAGYGSFKYDGHSGYAHRYAYEVMVGEIPDGLELDHLCRVRNCVNPEHLDPVTPSVNKQRVYGRAAR